MRRVLLVSLIVVNLVLVVTLIGTVFHPHDAFGQAIGLSGNFLTVAGGVLGTHADVVYVIDLANRELFTLQYNRSSEKIEMKGQRDLERDLAVTAGKTSTESKRRERSRRDR